ncbi:MAG: PQQ-binding-like beta-propeller repeat protein, partial [Candidatus Eremiobacterota bacterium]
MRLLVLTLMLTLALATLGCSSVPSMKPGPIVVQSGVLDLAISRDGSRLAIGSNDKSLKVVRTGDGFVWADLKGHEDGVWGVAFNSDGKQLASVASDSTVRMWDVETGKELWKASPGGYSVAFHPDDKTLAVGSDYKIRLVNARDGMPLKEIREETGNVFSVVYSSDGTRLASGSQVVRLWDPNAGTELWHYKTDGSVRALGIAPFQVLAAIPSRTVARLSITDGKPMKMSPVKAEATVSADGKLSAEPTGS